MLQRQAGTGRQLCGPVSEKWIQAIMPFPILHRCRERDRRERVPEPDTCGRGILDTSKARKTGEGLSHLWEGETQTQ